MNKIHFLGLGLLMLFSFVFVTLTIIYCLQYDQIKYDYSDFLAQDNSFECTYNVSSSNSTVISFMECTNESFDPHLYDLCMAHRTEGKPGIYQCLSNNICIRPKCFSFKDEIYSDACASEEHFSASFVKTDIESECICPDPQKLCTLNISLYYPEHTFIYNETGLVKKIRGSINNSYASYCLIDENTFYVLGKKVSVGIYGKYYEDCVQKKIYSSENNKYLSVSFLFLSLFLVLIYVVVLVMDKKLCFKRGNYFLIN